MSENVFGSDFFGKCSIVTTDELQWYSGIIYKKAYRGD